MWLAGLLKWQITPTLEGIDMRRCFPLQLDETTDVAILANWLVCRA